MAVRDAVVSEAFLRFFVETCGHYTEYICTQQDGLRVFEVDTISTIIASFACRLTEMIVCCLCIHRVLEFYFVPQSFHYYLLGFLAPCGLWGCKNRLVVSADQMSQKVTEPGSLFSLLA